MKRDGNEILYFKQLKNSNKDHGNIEIDPNVLTESLFKKYDYLLVTSENELLGIKEQKSLELR